MVSSSQSIVSLVYLLMMVFAAGEDGCQEVRCGREVIRFPFRIKGSQPDNCGYSGFDLSCTSMSITVLELPSQAQQLHVKTIDYKSQVIKLYSPDDCLPRQLRELNLSASPFKYGGSHLYNLSFFSCPLDQYQPIRVSCLDTSAYHVVSFPSDYNIDDLPELCTKMYDLLQVPRNCMYGGKGCTLELTWSEPECGKCERKGQRCMLVNNGRENRTECFKLPREHKDNSSKLEATSTVLGFFLLSLVAFALYRVRVYRYNRDRAMIEKLLEDYIALKPARYSYADLKRITNQFTDKLGQGAYGTVYKGKLSKEVLVAVKMLTSDFQGKGEDFVNEVGIMGRIHHVNVVRLVGFCAEGFRRALVYEFLPNESLEKFIYINNGNGNDKKKKHYLGWEKLEEISLGIAKGIEYLHQGCDQRILHFDIKPHNILLDHNFVPKVCDFGLAKLCSKDQSAVSMTAARGTKGYMAPEVVSRNFGNVSHKSDVYSFGMLLLEMVGGRKNKDVTVESNSKLYFPEWVYNRLEKGEELQVRVEGEGGGESEIARKLSMIGLWCIQWNPADRPSMKTVVQMIEGEGDKLRMPPNPFKSVEKPFHQALPVIVEME